MKRYRTFLILFSLALAGCGGDGPSGPIGAVGRVAFVRGGQVFVSGRNFSDEARVTDSGIFTNLSWSPGGQHLAIVEQLGTQFNVFYQLLVVNRDGGQGRQLAIGAFNDDAIEWTSDGTRLLVSGGIDTLGGDAGDWSIDVTSGVSVPSDHSFAVDPTWTIQGDVVSLTPSPDGSSLGIVTQRDGVSRLYAVGAQSGTVVQVTTRTVSTNVPLWSGDGQRLAFLADGQIYTVGAGGTGEIQETSDVHNYRLISWSPSGRSIAFSAHIRQNVTNFGPQYYIIDLESGAFEEFLDDASIASIHWAN